MVKRMVYFIDLPFTLYYHKFRIFMVVYQLFLLGTWHTLLLHIIQLSIVHDDLLGILGYLVNYHIYAVDQYSNCNLQTMTNLRRKLWTQRVQQLLVHNTHKFRGLDLQESYTIENPGPWAGEDMRIINMVTM